MHLKNTFFISLIIVLSQQFNHVSMAADLYELTDLGPLNITALEAETFRIKINQAEQIIAAEPENNRSSGFVWSRGDNNLWGSSWGSAGGGAGTGVRSLFGINELSQSVGFVQDNNGPKQARLWNSDFTSAVALGTLGGNESIPFSINDSGIVVGQSKDGNGINRAFIWSADTMTRVVEADVASRADDISESGWVSGTLFDGPSQAFVWNTVEVVKLQDVNSAVKQSWVSQINDQHKVVGGMTISVDGSDNPRSFRAQAYRWDSAESSLQPLGSNIGGASWAIGINSAGQAGQVVGGRLNDLKDRVALLWDNNNVALDLNKLIQGSTSLKLEGATDINDNGVIVGVATGFAGEYRAFMLKPVGLQVQAADLSIEIIPSVDPVDTVDTTASAKPRGRSFARAVSEPLIIEVVNNGPDDATDVSFDIDLDARLQISNLDSIDAECQGAPTSSVMTCKLAQLPVNAKERLIIDMTDVNPGDYNVTASITGKETDAGANVNNRLAKTIAVNASSIVIDEQRAPNNETPNDSPGENLNNQAESTDASSFGCALSRNTGFDPFLLLLCGLALLGIARKWRKN